MSRTSSSESLKPGIEQRHNLEPESARVEEPDGVEHGLEDAPELPVAPVVEPLEVDLVEVHPRTDVLENLGRRVAVRHVRAGEAPRLARLEHFHGPLAGDQRLVVGGGEDARAVPERELHDLGGGDFLRFDAQSLDRAAPARSGQFWQ